MNKTEKRMGKFKITITFPPMIKSLGSTWLWEIVPSINICFYDTFWIRLSWILWGIEIERERI